MWIVAGPNGSGKTSIAKNHRVSRLTQNVNRLNADDLAKLMETSGSNTPSLSTSQAAANAIDILVNGSIDRGDSFLVETVLSSPKYKASVRKARKKGFNIGLIFVYTTDPVLNAMRVKGRVQEGGHDVPSAKVLSRWPKSIRNFGWFAGRSDVVLVFDNSEITARLVLEKDAGSLVCSEHGPANAPLLEETIERARKAIARL